MFLWSLLATIENPSLITPPIAGWISVATLVASSILYQRTPFKWTNYAAITIYSLLVISIGITVAMTDGVHSPYLALWMIVAVLSAIFDLWGIGVLLAIVNAYLIYAFAIDGSISQGDIIVAIIAGEMPILISWILWISNSGQGAQEDAHVKSLSDQVEKESSKTNTIIEAIGDGVIVVKQTGEITAINPAAQKLTGWSANDALRLHFSSVLKIEDLDGVELLDDRNPVRRTLNTSQQYRSNDVKIVTKSGRKIDTDFVVSPTDGSDLGEGAIAIFRDVTKERAEEREQAEFISTASHEMRTPVAAIEGYLGLALNPNTAQIDAKAREYIAKAQDSAKHLGGLFQDLLDITRAEDGKLNSRPVVIDTVSFTRDLLESFKPSADEKRIQLAFRPDGSKATIGSAVIAPVLYTHVDRGHIREVLDNLMENAIKYTPEGGTVSVDVSSDSNDTVRFEIKDSGVGIPEEDISHLFQKFYRVDSTQTREIGGTGLGLYLCRKLVESMQGRIWVESSVGSGSSFFVSIPRIDHQKAHLLMDGEKKNQEASDQSPDQQPQTTETPSPQPAPAPTPAPVQTPVPMPTVPPQLARPVQTPTPTPAATAAPQPAPTPAPQPQTPAPIESPQPIQLPALDSPRPSAPAPRPQPAPAPAHTSQPQPVQAPTPVAPQPQPQQTQPPRPQPQPSAPQMPPVQPAPSPQPPTPTQPPRPAQPQPQTMTMSNLPDARAPIQIQRAPGKQKAPVFPLPLPPKHLHEQMLAQARGVQPVQAQQSTPGAQPQAQSQHPTQVQAAHQHAQQPQAQQYTPASHILHPQAQNQPSQTRANIPLDEIERDPNRFIPPRGQTGA